MTGYRRDAQEEWLSDRDLTKTGYRRVAEEAEYDEEAVLHVFSVWENAGTGERYVRYEGSEKQPHLDRRALS